MIGGAAGRCWATRAVRRRVHRVSAPSRNYLHEAGWGVMADAAGRCRTTRSVRRRVHRVSAPARNYLHEVGWGVMDGGAGPGLRGQGIAEFIMCLRQRGII